MTTHVSATADACVLVIFGASGDLTHRKLVPALFELDHARRLPKGLQVIGMARTPMSDDEFRAKMRESAAKFASGFDAGEWDEFAKRLHYHAGDAAAPDAMPPLAKRIESVAVAAGIQKKSGSANVLFYLSVAPGLYEPIIANIGSCGLVSEGKRWCSIDPAGASWQRIIVEKPFGQDLHSAESLNRALGRVFEEDDIFRIDHYLGKELVQNILVMRFANSIFEPVWNRVHVDHVQVTAAETVGVGSRAANFYDAAGAMRDMIQSHLLQVLALVAMEPPSLYDAGAIMREKIKLFNTARPVPAEKLPLWATFGRYGPDPAKSEPAYADEKGVDPARRTDTFAAMRLEFDNWRWAGVPFYIRSGKKMATKLTEVVVQFRRPPTNPFRVIRPDSEERPGNRLVISIAPHEGITLRIEGKVPGAGIKLDSADLDLNYLERFGGEPVEAYGPLMLDAMRGDRTLYKHRDEVESGWRICQPFLDCEPLRSSIHTYTPGSWGPGAADELIQRDSPNPRSWHNPQPEAKG
ncbi:MAG: glucose-6-phosphate dehydrogenase [Phycisphaeraceae bacterium]|nr:glucose-6-phosphate dehydrogenase [Phycisphaeraceae bacterium]